MEITNKKKYCTDVKNVKQWLHSTNERCDSLKCHMKYLKILYHDMPKIQESKKPLINLNWQNSKIKTSNDDETVLSKQINYNNTFEEYKDTQCILINKNDDMIQKFESSVASDFEGNLSKINLQNKKEEEEKLENLNKSKETETELSLVSPRTCSIPQSIHIQSNSLSPVQKGNMVFEEHNWQHPYEEHSAEYSTELVENIEDSKKSFEQLILGNQNKYLLQELSSVRDDIKLNISGNIKNGSIDKNKICTKSEKKEKAISSALSNKRGSLCKLDDTVSLKIKKRRRKIHCSNSRSTVTTRDTNYLGKKDPKKRKQKNSVSNRHTFKPQQTSSEVVEIYHNTAVKSAMNKHQTVSVKPKCEDDSYQHSRDIDVNNPQNCSLRQYQSKQKTEGRSTNTNDINYNLEVSTTPLHPIERCNSHKCQHAIIQASYCNPIITHNYEMPTLASKLKRANRSYFGRFNFRNIPFVVGTSVTPSHNLGLNIQQVLSIMKTRQSVANGITPLLIRKISRGIKPASILMEQMNDQQSKLSYMNSEMNNAHTQKENIIMSKGEHLLGNENMFLKCDRKAVSNLNVNLKSNVERYKNIQERVNDNMNKYENLQKREDTRSENQLNILNAAQMLHATDNKMLKLFASQQNVKTEMKTSDIQSKIYQGTLDKHISDTSSVIHSQDSKGIREVLINLHDQFEEMNMKYEKLQAKVKKCSDKDLEEEILHIEKELSAKEDEINAVVNLYKEVMALKHQMRLLQEKNGYVCISTEIPLGSHKLYSTEPFTSSKSCGSSIQQRFQHGKGSSVITTREPTSLRLAGLLRQIQTFQKQLKLMSW